MTIQEYVAEHTERVGKALAHFLLSTTEGYRVWNPTCLNPETGDSVPIESGEKPRSALELVAECVFVNHTFARILRGETVTPEEYNLSGLNFPNAEIAIAELEASTTELAQAIRTLSDQDLDRIFQHPRAEIVGKNIILMPYRNMAYHAGQINYIQSLYGDMVFHVPANWR